MLYNQKMDFRGHWIEKCRIMNIDLIWRAGTMSQHLDGVCLAGFLLDSQIAKIFFFFTIWCYLWFTGLCVCRVQEAFERLRWESQGNDRDTQGRSTDAKTVSACSRVRSPVQEENQYRPGILNATCSLQISSFVSLHRVTSSLHYFVRVGSESRLWKILLYARVPPDPWVETYDSVCKAPECILETFATDSWFDTQILMGMIGTVMVWFSLPSLL